MRRHPLVRSGRAVHRAGRGEDEATDPRLPGRPRQREGAFEVDVERELRAQVTDLATGHELLPPPRQGTVRLAGSVIAESVWAATEDGALMRSTGEHWASVDLPARDPAFY